MPKINVYLPDDLAESVRQAGVPVSAICQRALEHSVRRVSAIRATVLAEHDDPAAGLDHFTARARAVIGLAVDRGRPAVDTEHLLSAVVEEGANLALHVLRALGVDPAAVAKALPSVGGEGRGPGSFAPCAANALELAVTEALSLGHNYVGCEHLLLGLVAEPDGVAGAVLRGLGADARSTRQAVVAALAGLTHQRGADPLEPVLARLDRLERHAGLR